MDIAIETGNSPINKSTFDKPAPIRTSLIENDGGNEIEATDESSPSPKSKKSRRHSKRKDESPDRIKDSSISPTPRDDSIASPDTIRSRRSVDKTDRRNREKEKEREKDKESKSPDKEKDKDRDSRRKSRSKKDRDEPSFLESTEFKLTM